MAIVVLDHIRKERSYNNRVSIEDIKGTGGKAQNADAVIIIERKGPQMRFTCSSKDCDQETALLIDVSPQGAPGEKFVIAADLSQKDDQPHVKLDPNRQKIWQVILDHGDWCASGDLRRKTGLSTSTIHRTLEHLLTTNAVESNGKKGRWTRYRIPPMRFGPDDLA